MVNANDLSIAESEPYCCLKTCAKIFLKFSGFPQSARGFASERIGR